MKNKKIAIISLVMLINALSYGIMIPLVYPYAKHFGMNPTMVGMLFASFSIAQFIATPIMGRLSDKYGRKPLLLLCVFGTSLSLALFALAQSIPMLFIARILDGITGGNNSVAQAIVADSSEGKERAKAFGFLGAAFGVGFLFGPAIGGLLGSYNITYPFWFASALAMFAVILGAIFLEETLPEKKRQSKNKPFFKLSNFSQALRHPLVGGILLVSLLSSTGHNSMIVGFQTIAFDTLGMTTGQYGLLFTGFGIISVFIQMVGIGFLLKVLKNPVVILQYALTLSALTTTLLFVQHSFWVFVAGSFLYAASLTPQGVMITSLISQRTDGEDQGAMLGINQSIISLGQIFGPILASAIIITGSSNIFIASTLLFGYGAYIAFHQAKKSHLKVSV